MSQSKSILMPFIIIAALLFGGALAWKMVGNTEEVKTEEQITPKVKKTTGVKKPQKTIMPDITVKTYDTPEPELPVVYTEEEKIENKKISRNFMKFSMRYENKAAVEKGLKQFKEIGNREKFDHLVMFAEENFPDVEIPSFD